MSKSAEFMFIWKLFDDPGVREKVKVMDKWEAMLDDSRNEEEPEIDLEAFLEFGKSYRISLCIEEIEENV